MSNRQLLPEALYDLLLDNIAELKRVLAVRGVELKKDQFEILQRELRGLEIEKVDTSRYTDCGRPKGSPYEGQD